MMLAQVRTGLKWLEAVLSFPRGLVLSSPSPARRLKPLGTHRPESLFERTSSPGVLHELRPRCAFPLCPSSIGIRPECRRPPVVHSGTRAPAHEADASPAGRVP